MNDTLDLQRDLSDSAENITMKIKKSRRKYDKQEKIEKNRTIKKTYKTARWKKVERRNSGNARKNVKINE